MHPPFPVIVGVPRSGTTLLRMMLSAGPELVIPPETHFLRLFVGPDAPPDAAAAAEAIAAFPTFEDFGIAPGALRQAATTAGDSPADAVRAFYRLYAARHGRPRAGEKTPGYGALMPGIAALLPEARFVHVVRDGRDVAVSLRAAWFAPSQDIAELATTWSDRSQLIADLGAEVPHYLELRFEDLLRQPEASLRRVSAFLGLGFSPAMLDPGPAAARLLAEHGDRHRPDGSVLVTREARQALSRRTLDPPDPSRIGSHRDALTAEEIAQFERIAGPALRRFGYA